MQRATQLLRKFPGQIERDAFEIGITQQFVQVVTQQFKHHADMLAKNKMMLHFDDSIVLNGKF